jgi:hypothetical protein
VGWQGVEAMAWTCECEFPSFYPMDMATGKCEKSSQVCRHGTWTYPCKLNKDDFTKCDPLTFDEEQALIGTAPLMNGLCDCQDVPCKNDDQCAVACVGGKCANQRLGLDPTSGLPVCVQDTCKAGLPCVTNKDCGAGVACLNGFCASSEMACTTDKDCPYPIKCKDGKCFTGEWKIADFPPYTYGFCDCPDGCTSTGYGCDCSVDQQAGSGHLTSPDAERGAPI